jgi:ABC-type transport system substrate-binding protein
VLAAGCALAGCPDLPDGPRYLGAGHRGPVRGGTLMLSEQTRVRSLDPHIAYDVISGSLIKLLFDGLYEYGPDMRLRPSLAEALPTASADGKTLTIQLRQGRRFHNGREITAEDVVYSIERTASPQTHSPGASLFRPVRGFDAFRAGEAPHLAGLRAKGRYQVEIQLDQPDQTFTLVLAMHFAAPVPREAVEQLGSNFARRPVGSGPFRLVSWDPGVRLVFERAPVYDGPAAHLDGVVFEESIPLETAFLRFRNGEQDVVTRVSPPDRAVLLHSRGWKAYFQVAPIVDVWGLVMNCELPPFDNVHVRRAVAFAVDRERWAKVRSGALRPTGQMVPPQLAGFDPKLPSAQRFDLAEARKELKLAGYPDGLKTPVVLWINEGSAGRAYAELTQADLGRIGIPVEIKVVSFPVFLEASAMRGTVQLLATGWQMDFPDASNFLELLHSDKRTQRDSVNRAFYSNPKLDALLDRARFELDPVRREKLLWDANELVAHEAPWAFFGNNLVPQAWQPYVKNYRPHAAYWLPVTEVWLDLPKRRATALAQRLTPFGNAFAHRSQL